MTKPLAYATLLLLTSNLIAPAVLAQAPAGPAGGSTGQGSTTTPPATTTAQPAPEQAAPEQAAPDQTADPAVPATDSGDPQEEEVEISAPGADPTAGEGIVVTGRNIPNVIRATPQVVSVLSAADIARTGEGDIAGALTRVTGLSVVGNGFVFVRGLGDRYSSALLNGSPLPSPEPLRRTVPLDIFPTTVVGSAVVQKTYSVNYPGEFGGGVINLTTRAVPTDPFFSIGGSIAFDTVTSSEFGYVYDGGDLDWLGYDDGARRKPGFIDDVGRNGQIIPSTQVSSLTNAPTTLLQRNNHIPANFSGEFSYGSATDIGDGRLGVILSGNVSNSWRTRDATQQDTNSVNGDLRSDFRSIITDNRVVANALVGLGYEFGDQTIRWTTVYIHDTLKQAIGADATLYANSSGQARFDQNTNWFERQLLDTQFVGEFDFDRLDVDVRGSFAKTMRDSPYERFTSYLFNPTYNAYGITLVPTAGSNQSQVAFSELDEDQWAGAVDLSYELNTDRPFIISAGYAYSDADRFSTRYSFQYRYGDANGSQGQLPLAYQFLRPDLLFSPDVRAAINGQVGGCPAGECIILDNISGGQGASIYDASLRTHAGYVQVEAEAMDGLRATIGVRYEDGEERVSTNAVQNANTTINNGWWLPASTITWNFAENQQVRLHASKTIARPQFRELAPQFYQDFDSNRLFFGNPNLVDSELFNLEARYEWFFDRGQRLTAAGFFKEIKNPIEQVSAFPTPDSRITTGFSYVPKALLYGGEVELQKHFPLDFMDGDFWASRRILVVANYTYTHSEITADGTLVPDITSGPGGLAFRPANTLYRDGAPLTGQSDHLVNFQLGIEDTESTSQLTLLVNYASDRVTARGASTLGGNAFLPDVVERPGVRLDVVARQGIEVGGANFEVKFEARNLTGTRYQEFQDFGDDTRVFINRYNLGRVFSLGLSATL